MDLVDKIQEGQNFLEKIASKIPGFKGYRDKERRREADRISREHMAVQLEGAKKDLDTLAANASRVGALDAINDIETARKRLDKVAARIRYADRGYAGFFDAVKVDDAMLDRVYRFDLALLAGVGEARESARAAGAAAGGVRPALEAFIGNLDALRDWGHARDYVRMQWLMLQQEEPEDYVIATGETHTVQEFVERAFAEVGIAEKRLRLKDLERERAWSGKRLAELDAAIAEREAELALEADHLSAQVRAAYMSGNQEKIKLLLNQRDPAMLGRMMAYYNYFNDYRADNITAVSAKIRELAEMHSEVAAEEARLADLARTREAELEKLATAQQERQELLAALKDRIAAEGREIDAEDFVLGNLAQLATAQAQQVDGLVEAVVGLPGHVEGELGDFRTRARKVIHLRQVATERPVDGQLQAGDVGQRAAVDQGAEAGVGQAEEIAEPADDALLHRGAGRGVDGPAPCPACSPRPARACSR